MLAASVLLGIGCDTSSSECPSCPAQTGGESSDFGGTPHPCTQFERPVASDADTAASRGFDVATLVARIERAVDAPLYWQTHDGGEARGYDRVTRIQMNARVRGFTHIGIDPELCGGTTCRQPGGGDEYTCSERLELDVEAHVQTADGAITAAMRGYVLYGREGSRFHEMPGGTLRANLSDVDGSLELREPSQPLRLAELMVDFYVRGDRTHGDIKTAWTLWDGSEKLPMWGTWPEPVTPIGNPSAGQIPEDP